MFTVENLLTTTLSLRTIVFNNFGNDDRGTLDINGSSSVVSGVAVAGPLDPYEAGTLALFEGFTFSMTGLHATNGFFVQSLVFVPEPPALALLVTAVVFVGVVSRKSSRRRERVLG